MILVKVAYKLVMKPRTSKFIDTNLS